MSVLPLVANLTTAAGGARARVRFARALRDPRGTQSRILQRILRANAASEYGRRHGFDRIVTARDFAERVPLMDYDAMAPWIDRVARGESAVLTAAPVRFMEPTGGSSGMLKLVPYTASLLEEFAAATMPWLCDLIVRRPTLARGRAYWSITPPGRRETHTPGGIPIGMSDDADYFPAPLRALLRKSLAVPGAVALAPDVTGCRYLTLRALLATPDLAFISVWSPSFLTLLADALDEQWGCLLHDMAYGTIGTRVSAPVAARITEVLPPRPDVARALRQRFGGRAPDDLGLLWRQLGLISCWTDASAGRALGGMRRRFPDVEIQGKGLLATEGVVSIPLGAGAPVAAVGSHYLEFLDPRDGRAYGADEVELGGTYEIAMTTGGGLYRYRLRDIVRVEGRLHRAPRLSFVGRADRASDIAGEKLTAPLVEQALGAAARAAGVNTSFAMLAPAWTPAPHYRLYVEAPATEAAGLAIALDRELLGAHHYALCRSLGQLGPVRGVSVQGGERIYEKACAERGQRAGAIKPPALESTPGWERYFERDETPMSR
ncbi:MAG TPA: GH3 auxin-responsive promoter family protein [Gemmatimonadaceae bacterium]|nr:GH3 auxin-responsive promoter family protein [Gemmatimonadaceae bacterium]